MAGWQNKEIDKICQFEWSSKSRCLLLLSSNVPCWEWDRKEEVSFGVFPGGPHWRHDWQRVGVQTVPVWGSGLRVAVGGHVQWTEQHHLQELQRRLRGSGHRGRQVTTSHCYTYDWDIKFVHTIVPYEVTHFWLENQQLPVLSHKKS